MPLKFTKNALVWLLIAVFIAINYPWILGNIGKSVTIYAFSSSLLVIMFMFYIKQGRLFAQTACINLKQVCPCRLRWPFRNTIVECPKGP